MSWIGGEFILNDVKKKDLDAAADRIRYAVRSNANLAEFPNMGCRINPLRHICPQKSSTDMKKQRRLWKEDGVSGVAIIPDM